MWTRAWAETGAAEAGRGGRRPRVSVLMSVYNGRRWLGAALASVLDQDFRDLELIAVDDGSTDGSGELLARAAERDPRVRPVRQENLGIVAALNRAAALAAGEYLARMDADDLALPGRLARQVEAMESDPGLGALGGAIEIVDELGRLERVLTYPLTDRAIRTRLLAGDCALCHPATLIRRAAFAAAGGYRSGARDAEDYDLWLRISESYRLANLAVPVLRYRRHPGQVSVRRFRRQALATLAARAAYGARAQGLPDPLDRGVDGAETLDGALDALGVDAAARAAAVARAGVTCIGNLCEAGEHAAALALADEVRAAPGEVPIPRAVHADLRLVRARVHWRLGRPVRALASALAAVAGRPIVLLRPLKRALSRAGYDIRFDLAVAGVRRALERRVAARLGLCTARPAGVDEIRRAQGAASE